MPLINYDKKLLGKLKSNYFNAKVYYEMVKEQEEEIQRKILAENEFYETEENAKMFAEKNRTEVKLKRIYEPFDTYLMDLDNEFPRFLDLCYPEFVKAGIANPKGKEWCCDAEPRELFAEATKMLVDYAIEIIPSEFEEKETLRKAVKNIKWRDRVLDIVLRLESEEIESYV